MAKVKKNNTNPVVTLRAQAEKFGFGKLRADEKNKLVNSGETMYNDFTRMSFIVNGKSIDKDYITQLYKKYSHLIAKNEDEHTDYRPFAKEVFSGIFRYAEAQVPNDSILEELITNCNQLGYTGNFDFYVAHPALGEDFLKSFKEESVNIVCTDPDHAKIRLETKKMSVFSITKEGFKGDKISDLSISLEFTVESQDGKKDVTYKDGKLLLTVPKELKNYKAGDGNLFDIIKEHFQKFCEKLGFKFETKIEHDLGPSLKVSSHLESVKPPIHSNAHEH